ncbi:hypothetical protein A2V47_09175 [Candidatus Atribacteria bacterium RBG_19FT_COMBO_35_14]|uniref:2-methylcitrate dehydratase n=1 Tax=Candidatus Sediminicultor quintus TaxID=1797291 RepID=A0A1F5A936_9BACT|nr:MAG: hypothetical protein A2V47_09175 [Candidatus Atribacteria bacterium RBG_19FT_COMBO_35_14]
MKMKKSYILGANKSQWENESVDQSLMPSCFIASRLANYITKTSFGDIPIEVVESAKVNIMDSISCMIGGLFTPNGKIVTEALLQEGDNLESSILGLERKTYALQASLINSILANALDYDDYYPLSHPNATIVPPGLAVSEAYKINGKAFLTAVVVANEVYLRIMRSLLPSKKQQEEIFGFGAHQTFGAAIVSGKLINLNEKQMAYAIGIAGANAPISSCAKTVWGDTPTMVKNNYGLASYVGVLASKLAKYGFTGPLDIFEGKTGFWKMSGSDQFKPEEITRDLGINYLIKEIQFKPYPCCRWLHSSLDAILKLKRKYNFEIGDIEKIEVKTHSLTTVYPFTNSKPKTLEEAIFSFKYLAAVVISGIPLGQKWYDKETLNNLKILALAEKVEILEDEEVNSCYPDKLLSKVSIYISNGKCLSTRVDYPKGTVENPIKKYDIEKKFKQLTQEVFTDEKVKQILAVIWKLEQLDDINKLTSLFHPTRVSQL